MICVVLGGCNAGRFEGGILYPIDSLLNAQVHFLAKSQATLTKVMALDSQRTESVFKLADTTAWQKELEIFQMLDAINKPINRDLYHHNSYADARSNLTVEAFTTSASHVPVQQLKVFYQQTPRRIKRLEGVYREMNSLYQGTRFLTMEFQQLAGQPILTAYSIEGGQKMVFRDSVHYSISGALVFNE